MKKINFLSSTKLLVATIGLIVGAFLMLSMSFPYDPAYMGPNVYGPKHSHFYEPASQCAAENKVSDKDYAKAVAITTGGGTVTLSDGGGGGKVTNAGGTSGTENGNSVTFEWNCNDSTSGDATISNSNAVKEKHLHTVIFTATPDASHNFKGWSTDGTEAKIVTKMGSVYKDDMFINDWDAKSGSHDASNNALTHKFYAIFGEKKLVSVTMSPTTNGKYTYSCPKGNGTISTVGQTITTDNAISLTAIANSGYKFFGWYTLNGSTEEYFSYDAELSKSFGSNTTIYAKFIPDNSAIFIVKGLDNSKYYDLNAANAAETSSSSKTIVVETSGTLAAGDYTISSGNTLLIPYEATYKYSERPTEVKTFVAISQYRKLTLAAGSNIAVYGTLCAAAQQYGNSNSTPGPGSVSGAYGCIDMSNGGHITIESGGLLNAQGFIIGKGDQSESGKITILAGGKVLENLVVQDMHGGGGTAATVNGFRASNNYGLFPFNQYYVQNIEPKMTIEYGGKEQVVYDIVATGLGQHAYCSFIGSEETNLFTMTEGSTITKWYDATRDYQCYSTTGSISLNELSVQVSNMIGIVSSKYVLPVPNNMDITIQSGTISLDKDIKLLPGCKFKVAEGSTLNLSGKLYIYDCNEWDKYAMGSFIKPMNTSQANSPSVKIERPNTQLGMGNASLIVDGTINVSSSGAIYTTSTGASIISNANGSIHYDDSAQNTDSPLYEIYGTYGRAEDGTALAQGAQATCPGTYNQVKVGEYSFLTKQYYTYGTFIACTPAQLRNSAGDTVETKFFKTSGLEAGATVQHANGHWGWMCKWVDTDGTTQLNIVNSLAKTTVDAYDYPDDKKQVGYTYTWEKTESAINQEVVYKAVAKKVKHTITFQCDNGDILLSNELSKGATVTYSGTTPTKDADAQYTYAFKGWIDNNWVEYDKNDALPDVGDADVTYTATFTATPKSYTLAWNLNGGSVTTSGTAAGSVAFGTSLTAPKVERTGYIFKGWSPTVPATMPAADATYTALWTPAETGDYLDIVDWTDSSLTINTNALAASGWPYTINDVEYQKTARMEDRTLIIPYTGSADGVLDITVNNKNSETVSKRSYTIPHIYDTNTNLSGVDANSIVYIHSGAIVTVAANTNVKAIYVAPNADLVVSNGVTLTLADKLVLRTTPWAAAALDNRGTISGGQVYYSYIIANKDQQYYQFAMPLASNTNNVKTSDAIVNNRATEYPYNTAWLMKYYSESSRANNGATGNNWVALDPGTISGTVGYELFSMSKYYREYYFPITLPNTQATTVAVQYTNGSNAADNGWNAVCSPLTKEFRQVFANPSTAVKVSELMEDGRYYQHIPTTIRPAVPFYYQASQGQTQLVFGSEMTASAPYRAIDNEEVATEWLQVNYSDAQGRSDETNIFLHPTDFVAEYENGLDVAKLSTTGARPFLYTSLACGDLAFAALPDEAAQRIPLTVYSPANGEYTFSLTDNDYMDRMAAVYLVDEQTGIYTNLLSGGTYSVAVEQGTTTGRFYLMAEFAPAPGVATGMDEAEGAESITIEKVFIDGLFYIRRGGELYDLNGRLVK